MRAGGDDDVASPPATSGGCDRETLLLAAHRLHPSVQYHRQREPLGVAGEVVSDPILAWVLPSGPGKGQTRQGVEAGWSKQAQGVPPVPPAAAHGLGRVEEGDVLTVAGQVVSGGQAGLTGPDDDGAHFSVAVSARHVCSSWVIC